MTYCIDNPTFEAHVVGETLLLETIDWDKEEFKIDELEWEISVLDDPNKTSKLEIMPDENEINTEQLDALQSENSLLLEFLNRFEVNQFMEIIKEKS